MRLAARLILCGVGMLIETGCTMSRDPSHWMEQRTAIEQLLFSQALERSAAPITLPLPPGAPVAIDAVAPSPPILVNMLRETVTKRLGALGLRILKNEKEAAYLVRIIAQSLGTEQGNNLVGLPSMSSALLPISTPEIALFREEHHQAMVRLLLDVFEAETGRHVLTSPWYEGTAYFNQYTVAIIFGFRSSDVDIPD